MVGPEAVARLVPQIPGHDYREPEHGDEDPPEGQTVVNCSVQIIIEKVEQMVVEAAEAVES